MLENYDSAASRIAKFWNDHPYGRIITSMLEYDGERVVFRAELYTDRDDTRPASTGWAEEIKGSTNVNKTSFVENCETSAIARAAANYIYAASDPDKRPSREEMAKVQRLSSDSQGGVVRTLTGQASEKQIGYIKGACKRAGVIAPGWLDTLSKQDASAFIDAEKNGEPIQQIIDRMRGEEAF